MLKVSNIVMTGRIPIKKKLDYGFIIKNSKFDWRVINEEYSPILQTIRKREGELNIHKITKGISVSVWNSGAINICGLKTLKEGREVYELVLKEMRRMKL